MGYLRGVRHGAIIGAVLALLYAPDAGAVTRRRLARWLGQLHGSMEAEKPRRNPGKRPAASSRQSN